MQRILTFITWLTGYCLKLLNDCFVAWTTPATTSLLLGTLTDQARSKSELVAENAFLRQQLIILRRQVKRPACTKTDRMLLVLLERMVRTWKQALFIIQPETRLALASSGLQGLLEVQVEGNIFSIEALRRDRGLDQGMARDNRLWGAERIRGELLTLGIHVCKRTIQKYMRAVRTTKPGGQMLAYELGACSVIMYRETSCFPCVCAHDLALFPPYSLLEVDERGNRSGAGSTQFSLPPCNLAT